MAKLYFRYGTVGSAKTLNLLAVAHSYRQQGKAVVLMKPDLDTRFGRQSIKSRAGLEMQADLLIVNEHSFSSLEFSDIDCILIDEAQFLSGKVIEELRRITLDYDIPVICYGLRTDFKSRLFDGSQRLMELSDSIEEVKATCHYCNKKSIMNLKHTKGLAVSSGASIDLGAEEKYVPACFKCYRKELEKTNVMTPSFVATY